MGSGVSDLSTAGEPSNALKMQTRGASVPTQMMTFKECSSQSKSIVQLRYSQPRLTAER